MSEKTYENFESENIEFDLGYEYILIKYKKLLKEIEIYKKEEDASNTTIHLLKLIDEILKIIMDDKEMVLSKIDKLDEDIDKCNEDIDKYKDEPDKISNTLHLFKLSKSNKTRCNKQRKFLIALQQKIQGIKYEIMHLEGNDYLIYKEGGGGKNKKHYKRKRYTKQKKYSKRRKNSKRKRII
jgi:hypothetical protein